MQVKRGDATDVGSLCSEQIMIHSLQKVRIESFRGIRNLELIDLGRINLLVGVNNSGKTSLIEALSILCDPLNPFAWLSISKRRLLRSHFLWAIPEIEMIKWIFPQNLAHIEQEHSKLEISAWGNSPIRKVSASLTDTKGTNANQIKKNMQSETMLSDEDDTRIGVELEVVANTQEGSLTNLFQFWENERFSWKKTKIPSINNGIILPFSASAESFSVSRLTQVIQGGLKDEIIDVLRWFDPDIRNLHILVPSKKPILNVEHDKIRLAPLHIFGDGLRRVLMIALTVTSIKNGILLIDEIETAIHISVLGKVFSWLVEACRRRNIQLFATTHSLEAIDAILKAEVDKDHIVGFRLGNDEQVKRFSGDLLYRLRYERGLDMRGE